MTKSEVERLAILETRIDDLANDVTEIKSDVKVLLAAKAASVGIAAFLSRVAPYLAIGISVGALVVR